jgi:predicted nucleic acid-binding protein
VALILDTGPLLAALDAADPDHARCAPLLGDSREDLVVPLLVLAELDHWCHERLGAHVWLAFLEDLLEGAYRVEQPSPADLRRCHELQSTYDTLALGVVDASVIALAERLGETRIATLDNRHFSAVRPAHTDGFDLVPPRERPARA